MADVEIDITLGTEAQVTGSAGDHESGHIGPADDCGCCNGDCIDEPEVNCGRQYGFLYYSVKNATFAELREYCEGKQPGIDAPDSTESVTLDADGNARGSWQIVDPDCNYCIYAENECGANWCCAPCGKPTCYLSFSPAGSHPPGKKRLVWIAFRKVDEARFSTITVGGVSQTFDPDALTVSGVFDYDCIDYSGPNPIQLVVTNKCGVQSICEHEVQCYYEKSYHVTEYRDFPAYYHIDCPWTFGGDLIRFAWTLEGLDKLNGTWIEFPDPDTCGYTNGIRYTGEEISFIEQYDYYVIGPQLVRLTTYYTGELFYLLDYCPPGCGSCANRNKVDVGWHIRTARVVEESPPGNVLNDFTIEMDEMHWFIFDPISRVFDTPCALICEEVEWRKMIYGNFVSNGWQHQIENFHGICLYCISYGSCIPIPGDGRAYLVD